MVFKLEGRKQPLTLPMATPQFSEAGIEGYIRHDTGGCLNRDELGSTTGGSAQDCADSCTADPSCVSFEYEKEGTECRRSTSCNGFSMTVNNPDDPYLWYLKDVMIQNSQLHTLVTTHIGEVADFDGELMILGSPKDNAAYILEHHAENKTWEEVAQLVPSDSSNDSFGCSVAISGDTAVVGTCAPDEFFGLISDGKAYVFTRSADKTWNFETKLEHKAGTAAPVSSAASTSPTQLNNHVPSSSGRRLSSTPPPSTFVSMLSMKP